MRKSHNSNRQSSPKLSVTKEGFLIDGMQRIANSGQIQGAVRKLHVRILFSVAIGDDLGPKIAWRVLGRVESGEQVVRWEKRVCTDNGGAACGFAG